MRLSDMRLRRDDAPLPTEIEAELDALDAALRGEAVPADMEGLDALVNDLRAERATPDAEFGDALDAWAASGFRREDRRRLGKASGDPFARVRSMQRRRLLVPAGAAATLVVAVVAISQVDFQSGGDGQSSDSAAEISTQAKDSGPVSAESAPERAPAITDEVAPGALERRLRQSQGGLSKAALDRRAFNDTRYAVRPGPAGGQEARKIDRDAQLTLAAPADEVQDVTNDAIGVVETNRGIVESSQTSGTDDQARSTLQLVIPTRTLDATLDELSDLADVKSLNEGTVDITRPFVDAKDRLAGLRAERKSVISQIRVADTEEELDALRVRLDGVQAAVAKAEAEFENIQRRATLSSVTLQITSEGADEGDWSLEDALDDAGRVLTVGAGIALISAAVMLPLALIAAIAYFVMSAAKNRARERALDE